MMNLSHGLTSVVREIMKIRMKIWQRSEKHRSWQNYMEYCALFFYGE
nr:hypothetical protein Iba_chr05cCG3940 [Ipomoea batatas]